eukprot:603573-Pleurochrysis_carterae.AAC.1
MCSPRAFTLLGDCGELLSGGGTHCLSLLSRAFPQADADAYQGRERFVASALRRYAAGRRAARAHWAVVRDAGIPHPFSRDLLRSACSVKCTSREETRSSPSPENH